ncbi:MAG: trimethylamine methyltransferase family protein [Geminicoccaceae bacterium]
MSESGPEQRRRGGREARRELRARPLEEKLRPIRPGLEGGRYKPLDDGQIKEIHEAALDVLEQIGFTNAIPSCVEACTRAGAFISSEGRLCFPRSLVEDTVARAARRFPVYGRDPRHDMEPWGTKVYFGTAGAAVHMVDPTTRHYRESELRDLYDAARIVDALDHIHYFQRTMVPRDMKGSLELDVNTLYACLAGTTKHIGTSFVHPEHLERCMEMLHLLAGGEAAWRARPFVSLSCCFVVPPMKFAEDACRVMETAARAGMPVLLLAAGQAGATSPAALAGAVVQEVAECLGALVYLNAIVPGAPAIFGPWPFVSDLRTGAMSGGSGEQAVLSAACAQMARFYDLPGGVCAGMSDSKLPDAQAGAEKAYNHALVANAGGNMIYEAAGMLASLLGFAHESLVLDNDIIGAVLRTVRGIETDTDSLSVQAIREACIGGPGHFLSSPQTLARMQTDYVYPLVGDRTSPKEWEAWGSSDAVERAIRTARQILDTHYPQHIGPAEDAFIRSKLPVRLPVEAMRPRPQEAAE